MSERTPLKNLVSRHTLGLRTHFTIDKELLQTAHEYNLRITQHGHGEYRYRIEALNGDMDRLCPPFIREKANADGLYSRTGMLEFLKFCRQPIQTRMRPLVEQAFHPHEQAMAAAEREFYMEAGETAFAPDALITRARSEFWDNLAQKKEKNGRIFRERESAHQLLRLVTTGSLVIPKKEGLAHLEKEHNECHAIAEEAMHTEHAWASKPEFGQSDSIKVTIPGTSYDPRAGFTFNIDQDFRDGTLTGAARAELREFLLRTIVEIKGQNGPYDLRQTNNALVLSASELQLLLERIHEFCAKDANLGMIANGRIETLAHRAVNNIGERKERLERMDSFQRLVAKSTGSPGAQIKNLLLCSSALTPVLAGYEMDKAHKRSHVNFITRSSAAGVVEEMAVFQEALRELQKKGTPTLADVEAFKHEFYPLLSFLRECTNTFDRSLKKAETRRNLPAELRESLQFFRKNIDDMQDAFATLGVTDFHLEEQFMDETYQELLRDLRKYIGEPGGLMHKLRRGGESFNRGAVMPLVDFFGDSIRFIVKNPALILVFSTLVGVNFYANNYMGKAKLAQAPPGMAAVQTVNANAFNQQPDENGIIQMGAPVTAIVPEKSLPERPPGYDPYAHWDLGIFGPYKHTVGGKVVEVSGYGLEGVRMLGQLPHTVCSIEKDVENSAFATQGQAMIRPTADAFLGLNILQNVSHAGFWTYTLLLGALFGLRALRHLGMFFGPMADLGKNAGLAPFRGMKGMLDAIRNDPVKARRLEKLLQDMESKGLEGLTQQDHLRNMLEVSDLVRSFSFDMDLAQKKTRIEITPQRVAAAQTAIDQTDILAREIGEHAGITEGKYQQKISGSIAQLSRAFDRLAETGSEVTFAKQLKEHLAAASGVEMRHAGSSNILDSLTATDKRQSNRLRYAAAHTQGTALREERREERKRLLTTVEPNAAPRVGLGEKFKQLIVLDPCKYYGREAQPAQISLGQFCANGISLGANYTGQGLAKTFRFTQMGMSLMPHKKPIAIVGAAGVIGCVEADLGGVDHPVVDYISGKAGEGTAIVLTGSTFMSYNYVEDALGVHVGMAAVDVGVGTAVGRIGYGKVARPVTLYFSEVVRNATGGRADIPEVTINIANHIGARAHFIKHEIWRDGISRPLARRAQLMVGARPDNNDSAPVLVAEV